jgi:hypothetical protein
MIFLQLVKKHFFYITFTNVFSQQKRKGRLGTFTGRMEMEFYPPDPIKERSGAI